MLDEKHRTKSYDFMRCYCFIGSFQHFNSVLMSQKARVCFP